LASRQQFVCSRIERYAVVPASIFHQDKTYPGTLLGGLPDERDINSFLSIQPKRHVPEIVLANSSDERHFCSEPGATHRLVRAFSAVVDSVARCQHRLARARQAFDFQRQTSCITSHHSDAWTNQLRISGTSTSMGGWASSPVQPEAVENSRSTSRNIAAPCI